MIFINAHIIEKTGNKLYNVKIRKKYPQILPLQDPGMPENKVDLVRVMGLKGVGQPSIDKRQHTPILSPCKNYKMKSIL